MRRLLATVLALSLAACAVEEEASDSSADAIQAGRSAEDGFAAVGMLVFPGGSMCNGTLVAPDLVLTTAQCLRQHGTPTEFYTGDGKAAATVEEATAGMARHSVEGAKVFPDYNPRRPFHEIGLLNPCRLPNLDVGLVKLKAPVDGVTPLSLEARAPRASETCTVVGFGRHDADGATTIGAKRSASMQYQGDRLDAFTFRGGSGRLASGDSGAPLVCGDSVVGVGACRGDVDFFARVDLTIAWIGRMRASWEEDRCSEPRELGAVAGDRGSDELTASGTCNDAVQFRVKELDGGLQRVPLKFTATLTSPPGEDFDLFVYESRFKLDPFGTGGHGGRVACGLSTARSEEAADEEDVVTRSWGDESFMSVDDARWITLEVRNKNAGCAAAPWELHVEGNVERSPE
ncbi:MAG: S1 family peptidase [Labilithrix sp.]|nr:S1 family peptidase [Labilithrix sp.]MCW5816992.1 S1 family peptidase [Labilithrix sp.]